MEIRVHGSTHELINICGFRGWSLDHELFTHELRIFNYVLSPKMTGVNDDSRLE